MSKKDIGDVVRKKFPLWGKILIGILVFILVLGGSAYAFVRYTLSKINTIDPAKVAVVEPESEYFEEDETFETGSDVVEMEPEEVEWDIAEDIMASKDVVNILLIGQDARPGETRARSDSMILATINKKKGTIQLTSFMRDMYVQIPGYSDNRINAAYAFGGMDLLDRTIETNFGITIDGNIEVNFSGFETIVDKINGINIDLNQVEADYLNKNGSRLNDGTGANVWALTAGTNHLNGEQALAYSRIRYVGNSDYERTDRQRKVLTAAFSKMKSSSITTILGLIDEVFPLLTTDIPQSDLLGYAVTVVSMGVNDIESYRVPVTGGFQSAIVRKMQVLVPDLLINRKFIQEILYGE